MGRAQGNCPIWGPCVPSRQDPEVQHLSSFSSLQIWLVSGCGFSHRLGNSTADRAWVEFRGGSTSLRSEPRQSRACQAPSIVPYLPDLQVGKPRPRE